MTSISEVQNALWKLMVMVLLLGVMLGKISIPFWFQMVIGVVIIGIIGLDVAEYLQKRKAVKKALHPEQTLEPNQGQSSIGLKITGARDLAYVDGFWMDKPMAEDKQELNPGYTIFAIPPGRNAQNIVMTEWPVGWVNEEQDALLFSNAPKMAEELVTLRAKVIEARVLVNDLMSWVYSSKNAMLSLPKASVILQDAETEMQTSIDKAKKWLEGKA